MPLCAPLDEARVHAARARMVDSSVRVRSKDMCLRVQAAVRASPLLPRRHALMPCVRVMARSAIKILPSARARKMLLRPFCRRRHARVFIKARCVRIEAACGRARERAFDFALRYARCAAMRAPCRPFAFKERQRYHAPCAPVARAVITPPCSAKMWPPLLKIQICAARSVAATPMRCARFGKKEFFDAGKTATRLRKGEVAMRAAPLRRAIVIFLMPFQPHAPCAQARDDCKMSDSRAARRALRYACRDATAPPRLERVQRMP